MKICVLGGTGNISTSIVHLLLQQGHEVICVNRGKNGPVEDGARWIDLDRNDQEKFETEMQAHKFDAAIDMICFSAEDAASSIRAFRDVGTFVQCSTVCTFGIDYDWLPATEDHPLRPITQYGRDKAAADSLYMEAYHHDDFPVVIIKPSTTYGPQQGLIRQIAWDYSWIDRIRKGKPLVVCADGIALHQFLHVDDAAMAFAGVLTEPNCIGQTYNLVKKEFTTWKNYHETAMKVLGKQVEIIGVPFDDLKTFNIPEFDICVEIFAHHVFYSPDKIMRDVPQFLPTISLENGMAQVIEFMDKHGRIPDSSLMSWEDEIVEAQRRVRPRTRSAE